MKHKRFFAALTGLCIAGSMMLNMGTAAAVKCDCNADGAFDILDVISLTKYLHLRGTLPSPEQADVDGDGAVDVFDLALMLRALVGMETDVTITSKSLSDKVQGNLVELVTLGKDFSIGQTQFALDLLRGSLTEGKNSLVSPYSVSQALGMTANGAEGKTLSEMESVLGGSLETLNPAYYTFRTNAQNDEDAKLKTANSIWVREGYPVSADFLQTNADYYGADAYATPMDKTTIRDVNHWVDKNTDNMIPEILPENMNLSSTQLLLANAVAFDANWMKQYLEYAVQDAVFTAADGTAEEAKMLCGSSTVYLEDDHATGFTQYYEGGRYVFAALLPEEGMSPEAYLDTLTAEGLYQMLSAPQKATVYTGIPEFEYDYSVTLNDTLKAQGMPSAFAGGTADFSGMSDVDDSLHIGNVLHKTHIEVTPLGTRAGAATVIEMPNSAVQDPEEPKTVYLDRPFVYAIVDTQTSVPVFIGTVNSVK